MAPSFTNGYHSRRRMPISAHAILPVLVVSYIFNEKNGRQGESVILRVFDGYAHAKYTLERATRKLLVGCYVILLFAT